MAIPFSATEIFDIAIQIEHNGAAFYRKAAGIVSDAAVRVELLNLATMEESHEVVFTDMRWHLNAPDLGFEWYDPDSEAAQYLESFAAGQVFDITRDPSGWLKPGQGIKEILQFAIERERDSIVFYLGMKELIPAAKEALKIDSIVKQEMGHVSMLNKRLAQVPAA